MSDSANNLGAVWGKVVAQSWSDDEYKSRLLDDPRSVLAEAGYSVPDGVDLLVTDSDPDKMHLVIPPAPEGFDGEISDEVLEAVAGGNACFSCCGQGHGGKPPSGAPGW